ncbi:protein NCA1 [Rhodamnia argentea]|uniref:Protein NCA1 n=1 Tax=Rhodamnia argentea TaxID=178133 RepID=A0A8B8PK62_9MYRT|nr:protein NCA1 [Rhodamnia argentea]
MTPVCPFVKASRPEDASSRKHQKEPGADSASIPPKCPFGYDSQSQTDPGSVSPKCPLGYDSQTFKLGPLSCMLCQALLFDCTKCVPCSHVFCKACILRFTDCPLCGADIESTEANSNLQSTVDRFIEGHGRIKRSHVENADREELSEKKTVIYEDVSLERGDFLVQQAMRAFRAQNVASAKSRLTLCAEDIRDQVAKMGSTSELCSQLGAVLGMLGDCCRAIGDAASAVTYFEESVGFLQKLPADDVEITHTLSVSLNKIGDLKYYDGDLQAARSYYERSLNVRRDAAKHSPDVPSQILDVAVSLAKVADVDRSLGNEDIAIQGFQEGIKLLESLALKSEDIGLEQRRQSVLEFLQNQLAEKEPK